MDKNMVKESLTGLVKEHADSKGRVNLAVLGLKLSDAGINYKELGHDKLTNFIEAHTDILEIRADKTHKPPVHFVKLRTESAKTNLNVLPKNALTKWADLKQYQTTINELKEFALDERWHYKNQNPDYPHPILVNYLRYTFYKLTKEKGKIPESGDYATFNTGLVDKRYEPIYALFEKNETNTPQRFKLVDFCIPGESFAGRKFVEQFTQKPDRAHYFNDVDVLYNIIRAGKPELDIDIDIKHILLDGVRRLPMKFLSENSPNNFVLQNPEPLPIEDRRKYYENLAEAIEADTQTYRNLTNRLKDATTLAVKRIQLNFKTAIPMYYPRLDKMSLLLPLSLVDDERVDVALVAEKMESGNYHGRTILTLDQAYNNARLVARPDSDWLAAEHIETKKEGEDDD